MERTEPMSKEVGCMVLLEQKVVPFLKEAAVERMRQNILGKYPTAVVDSEVAEQWCDGLCGVCEQDCDDDHEHNNTPHISGKHLQMVMTAEVSLG